MSLRKVTSQLARRNKISPTEQINRKLSPAVIESFNYRFSIKAMVFILPKSSFSKICNAQHIRQSSTFKSNTKSSLWNFMAGCERIGASFAKVLGSVISRENALYKNISKEFAANRVSKRIRHTPFDPSFKLITSYGQSKSAIDKILAMFEYEQKKRKDKTNSVEREQTDA